MRSLARHPTFAVFALEDPLPGLIDLPASTMRYLA
jgi:predicted ATP-grasp superfamily ATP-dependent carboligase